MKVFLRLFAAIVIALAALVGIRVFISEFGWILFVCLAFFSIAVSIVFVAVFSKAYKNWPV